MFFAPRAAHVQRVPRYPRHVDPIRRVAHAAACCPALPSSPLRRVPRDRGAGPGADHCRGRFQAVLDSVKAAAALRPYIAQVVNISSLGDSELLSRDPRTTLLVAAFGLLRTPTTAVTASSRTSRATLAGVLARGAGAPTAPTPPRWPATRRSTTTSGRSAPKTPSQSEARALPLTLVVLVVAFGALVAAALPLIVGASSPSRSRLGLVTIAAHFQVMSRIRPEHHHHDGGPGGGHRLLCSSSLTRFREELNRGLAPVDAAVRTVETAGPRGGHAGPGRDGGVPRPLRITTPMTDTPLGLAPAGVIVEGRCAPRHTLPARRARRSIGRGIDRPKWLARPLARFHAPAGWERWARWLAHRPWRAVALGGAAIALLYVTDRRDPGWASRAATGSPLGRNRRPPRRRTPRHGDERERLTTCATCIYWCPAQEVELLKTVSASALRRDQSTLLETPRPN